MLALRRLTAYCIDWCLFAVWAGSVLAIVVLAQDGNPAWTDDPWRGQAIGALVTTLPFAAYFVWCEKAPRGRTLGKRWLGLRVLRLDADTPPRLGRALGRTAVKLAPWEIGHTAAHQFVAAASRDEAPPTWAMTIAVVACLCALGYVATLFTPEGRTPHDVAAGTRVIRI